MQNRLQDLIIRLRQWPEHHQKFFAFGVSAGLTFVIGIGWAATLPGQFASLTGPLPATSQTAAASLSILPQSDAQAEQNTNATQSLQSTLNQGSQLFDSLKTGWSDLFSGSAAPASSTSTQNTAPSVTITDPNQNPSQNVQTNPDNPYTNLQYYVSDGVLITNPPAKSAPVSRSKN